MGQNNGGFWKRLGLVSVRAAMFVGIALGVWAGRLSAAEVAEAIEDLAAAEPPPEITSQCEGLCHFGQAGDYQFRFRGGMTYLNAPLESHVGGTYGLDGVLPISEQFGLYGAGRVNQFSGGTQLLGTVGAYKLSDPCGCTLADRLGAAVMFDHFTDSRGDDLNISRLRAQIGYALSCDTAIGVTYSTPLEDDDDLLFLAGGGIGPYSIVETIGGFVSTYVGDHLATLGVGYRDDDPTSIYVDLSVRSPLSGDNLYGYADVWYLESDSSWSVWLGLEYRFGPATRGCGGCSSEYVVRGQSGGRRGVWDDPTISNAFNHGENRTWNETAGPPHVQPPPPPAPFESEDG